MRLIELITRVSAILPYASNVVLHKHLAHFLVNSNSLPSRQTRKYLKKLVQIDPNLFTHQFLSIFLYFDVSTQWTLDLIPLLPSPYQLELWNNLLERPMSKSTIPLHVYFVTHPHSFPTSKLLQWAILLSSHQETLKTLQIFLNHYNLLSQEKEALLYHLLQQPKHPILQSILAFLKK
ncbi:hypothetical protein HMI55_006610 [Coelomomyces lativittatus]|nr:hypothetical protein HMI55_006610 [Coelomomyces lativittatus]KAJ1515999.1 hypothetical protein HMI56_000012 [Coelomomyces lativittatus]